MVSWISPHSQLFQPTSTLKAMLDNRKRAAACSDGFASRKRLKTSSPVPLTNQDPPSSGRAIAALLALTDPSIVAHVMHFIPHASPPKRGDVTAVIGTLVSLCRAVAPFDRALPRHFGPDNQDFWQAMVLCHFDFTTRGPAAAESNELDRTPLRLAVWTQLGVSFVPSEYGFLRQLQAENTDQALSAWPRKEDAFTLFYDLTLLVDKLRSIVKVTSSRDRPRPFVPCLRRPGAIEASEQRRLSRPTTHTNGAHAVPFVSRVRRSQRELFTQLITRHVHGWTHFRGHPASVGADERIDFYAGQSRLSNRWIGLTSVRDAGPRQD